MHSQVHSLGTCGGPNRRDRTPTLPDATRTPLNATGTQHYWTWCQSNPLGGRRVARSHAATETCPHLPAIHAAKTEPRRAISATSQYAPTGSTYAPRSPRRSRHVLLTVPINSCFVATPGRNRELFKVFRLTVAVRRRSRANRCRLRPSRCRSRTQRNCAKKERDQDVPAGKRQFQKAPRRLVTADHLHALEIL